MRNVRVGIVAVLAAACLPAAALAAGGNKVAVFHLNGPLTEKPQGDFSFLSFGEQAKTFKTLLERIQKADKDEDIKAILITVGAPQMGIAQIEELRNTLKACAKPVYMHVDDLSTGLYLLASGARHISVTPTGDVWALGFYAEGMYLKGLLDHLKVEPDFVHIGDYKSAGEMLYREGPSKEAEDNMNWLLDGLYDSAVKMIADARYSGDVEKTKKIIDGGPYLAEKALELGMIDSVKFRQDLVAELKTKFGSDLTFVKNYGSKDELDMDLSNPFAVWGKIFSELMSPPKKETKTAIAVVHVEGAIQTGEAEPNPFGGDSGAYSTTIRKGLDEAADDDSVKAVILRVDSPGGSALASEIIYDATQRCRAKKKPVVVTMGNVAASGGYYVSCGADFIYADPTTITASIGVVGGKIVTTGMWDWIGVKWHGYKRGANADIMSTSAKWDETDRNRVLGWMTEIYGVFKGHITEHRGKKLKKPIDEMAGGRVYTGKQALDLGLVDALGGFDDAVKKAADLATVGDYELRTLPKPKGLFEIFRDVAGGEEAQRVSLGAASPKLFAMQSPLIQGVLPLLGALDPQRVQALEEALTKLQIMHDEKVVLMSPLDVSFRWN